MSNAPRSLLSCFLNNLPLSL